MVDISVIIVSFNTKQMTLECISSIFEKTQGVSFEIIVVDNASSDGSVEAIESVPFDIRLIKSPDNLGFAAANNLGFLQAKGRYVLLLNSDTLLLSNALKECYEHLESEKTAGILGCRAILPSGDQQKTIFRDLSLVSLFINIFIPASIQRKSKFLGRQRYIGIDLNQSHVVDVVSGCFMLVRSEVITQVGPLDDSFFFYGEEAEWCSRIRSQNWDVVYYPGAKILHYGGASTSNISVEKSVLMAKGQLLLLEKTQGRVSAYLGNIYMLIRDLPRVCLWLMLKLVPLKSADVTSKSLLPSVSRFPLHIKYFFKFICTKEPLSFRRK